MSGNRVREDVRPGHMYLVQTPLVAVAFHAAAEHNIMQASPKQDQRDEERRNRSRRRAQLGLEQGCPC